MNNNNDGINPGFFELRGIMFTPFRFVMKCSNVKHYLFQTKFTVSSYHSIQLRHSFKKKPFLLRILFAVIAALLSKIASAKKLFLQCFY